MIQQNLLNPFPEAPTAAQRVEFRTNVIANQREPTGKSEDSLRQEIRKAASAHWEIRNLKAIFRGINMFHDKDQTLSLWFTQA